MRQPGIAALVPIALAAVLVPGCGSSDDETTATVSKAEFTKKANAICAKGEKKINSTADQTFQGGPPSRADIEKFANETAIPALQAEIDGIKALPVPEGGQAQVDAILAAAEQGLAKLKSDPGAITAGGSENPFVKANKLAKAYGLDACAS